MSSTYIGMTPFYIPIFTWYEVSYLYQSMEFVISKLLPAWVMLTPLTWPIWLVLCKKLQHLLTNFCYGLVALSPSSMGLLVSFISISNIFIRVHVIVGFSTNATSKQWLSLVVHYKCIIFNILCIQHISSCISFIKLRKCSYNQQDRV